MASMNYKDIAVIAQERRATAIPQSYLIPSSILKNVPKNLYTFSRSLKHFTHDETEIIESEAVDILQKIRDRIWTAEEVTLAFCKSAAVAQQLTNCITEVLFPEAINQARQLDQHLATTGVVVGPLHGLPISLKDCFITPPHPCSLGMAAYANEIKSSEEESVLVKMLRDLGAVAYVKTNVPVGMMMMETTNNVWGPTINPLHSGCSAGGSSGGEAALLAMRGSPLGIGTDIGGSIRIPAAFTNLYGLKPSFGRFPVSKLASGIPGQDVVYAVNGPMSLSLSTLNLYCSALLSSHPLASPWLKDPKCIPIPWRVGTQIQPPSRKLRLAFVPAYDEAVTAHPPIERALNETRAAVKAAGHEVVEWAPVGHDEILKELTAVFVGFGGPAIIKQTSAHDEPVFGAMRGYEEVAKLGDVVNSTMVRQMVLVRNALQLKYLERWQATKDVANGKGAIDGLIMAASPWAACRLGVTNEGEKGKAYFGYTAVWSYLDMPACTFPVTSVDAKIDKKRVNFTPLSEKDALVQEDYDPAFYDGAPVALQLAGPRLMEEKVLEMVAIVKNALDEAAAR